MLANKVRNAFIRRSQYRAAQTQSVAFFSKAKSNCQSEADDAVEYVCISEDIEYQQFCEKHSVAFSKSTLERFKNGSQYAALKNGNDIITSGWVAYRERFWIAEIDCYIDMASSNTAILYDFFTDAQYRGRGFYGKILNKMICMTDGPEVYAIYARAENESSQKGILKAGFEYNGSFTANDKALRTYLKRCGFVHLGSRYTCWGLKIREE